MDINTNNGAQSTARLLGQSSQSLSRSLARLSSGSKLISPDADAAGLAVSIRFDAKINRTQAALSNASNALSFSQTQDGFLQRIGQALDRMGELTILSQDVTKDDADRGLYNKEFQTLSAYISDVATKDFNGVSLFGSNALNIMTDSEGGLFSVSGIQSNYVASGISTTTTTNALPTGNTTFSPLSSTFDQYGFNGFGLTNPNGSSAGAFEWFDETSTINDFVNLFNSNGALSSASYDESTGQMSFTLNSGKRMYDQNNVLVDLGFSGGVLQGNGNMMYGDASSSDPQTFNTMLSEVPTTTTTTTPSLDISTASGAASALTTVKAALNQLATDRATVGANISRLTHTTQQLGSLKENLSAANSRIKDVDVAEESTRFSRYNILVQAGTAMLAQANNSPQSVLRLLNV